MQTTTYTKTEGSWDDGYQALHAGDNSAWQRFLAGIKSRLWGGGGQAEGNPWGKTVQAILGSPGGMQADNVGTEGGPGGPEPGYDWWDAGNWEVLIDEEFNEDALRHGVGPNDVRPMLDLLRAIAWQCDDLESDGVSILNLVLACPVAAMMHPHILALLLAELSKMGKIDIRVGGDSSDGMILETRYRLR